MTNRTERHEPKLSPAPHFDAHFTTNAVVPPTPLPLICHLSSLAETHTRSPYHPPAARAAVPGSRACSTRSNQLAVTVARSAGQFLAVKNACKNAPRLCISVDSLLNAAARPAPGCCSVTLRPSAETGSLTHPGLSAVHPGSTQQLLDAGLQGSQPPAPVPASWSGSTGTFPSDLLPPRRVLRAHAVRRAPPRWVSLRGVLQRSAALALCVWVPIPGSVDRCTAPTVHRLQRS